jgi:Ca2+-binding EF-hand superfamily protein
MKTYKPILEQEIEQIKKLFTELDREREGLVDRSKMYVDIKLQVRTPVKSITIDFTV